MRRLDRRVAALDRRIDPRPGPTFLAYARAVVAHGGGDSVGEAAAGLARWLATGRQDPCGPG